MNRFDLVVWLIIWSYNVSFLLGASPWWDDDNESDQKSLGTLLLFRKKGIRLYFSRFFGDEKKPFVSMSYINQIQLSILYCNYIFI